MKKMLKRSLVALCMLVVLCIVQVRAQDEETARVGEPPSISRSQFDAAGRMVGLTPEQKSAALDLYKGYRDQWTKAAQKMEDFGKGMEGGGAAPSPEQIKQMSAAFKNFMEYSRKIDRQLLDNYKLLLTPAQLEKWPKVERRIGSSLAGGMFGRSAFAPVNLAELAEQTLAPGEPSKELSEVADQYEEDFAKAMHELEEWNQKLQDDMLGLGEKAASMSQEELMKLGMNMMLEGQKKTLAAKRVNAAAVDKFVAAMPEEKRSRFQLDYYRSARGMWGGVNDQSLDKAFDAALALPDLSADEKTALAGVRSSYEAELIGILKAASEAQDKSMADATPEKLMSGEVGGMADVFSKQQELTSSTVRKARAALTKEHLAKVPAPLKQAEVADPAFEE